MKVFSDCNWDCVVTFKFSPFMQLLLNIIIFNVWLPEAEKEKLKGEGKGTGPLNPVALQLEWEGPIAMGEVQQWPPACLATPL